MLKESETIEFKKSTAELKGAVVSIAAMLNKHRRGEVYFGTVAKSRMIQFLILFKDFYFSTRNFKNSG